MSYNPEVFVKIKEIYEGRRKAAGEKLQRHMEEVRDLPGMWEIEQQLSATGVHIMEALKKQDGGMAFEEVRRKNEALAARRAKLLETFGYPADYCDPEFFCNACGDTGFVDGRRCACMKRELYTAQAALSGLGRLLEEQSFENFENCYYKDPEKARAVKDFCAKYAAEGYKQGQNLMLMGATGMGKTHLSTAVADRVMRGGGSVIYESAPNIFADFQYERFGRGYSDLSPVRTDKYFGADLLIIDDLGSELVNQFTVSVLYNLINTRLNNRMALLINTNFTPGEIEKVYDRRITSRIFSEFVIFLLEGKDIRMQKL